MSPSVVVSPSGEAQLVVGATGGTRITSSIALVAMETVWFRSDIEKAISRPRLHHQLMPMAVQIEKDFDKVRMQSYLLHFVLVLSCPYLSHSHIVFYKPFNTQCK